MVFGYLVYTYFKASNTFYPPLKFVIYTALLMLLFGVIIVTNTKPKGNNKHFSHHYEPASILAIRLEEELKSTNFNVRFYGKVIRVNQKEVEGRVLIRIPKKEIEKPLELDDLIYTSAPLFEINGPKNPGGFDFRKYYAGRGIRHQLTLYKNQIIQIKLKPRKIKNWALLLRERIIASLAHHKYSDKSFSVIQALLLGKRHDLSEETIRSYQDAGAMHLLAISGLHIGILMAILNALLRPLKRVKYERWIRLILLLGFLWTFAFLSGLSPSVIRAVSMFSILSLGMIRRLKSRLSNYLMISLFISLVIKPLYVFDLGFQLSYAAVIAILEIGPLIKNLWKPKHKLLGYLWNLFVISIAAQLGVLPLCLYYFHQMSGLFLLSSLIVIPFLGLILSGGYLMILLDRLGLLQVIYVMAYDKVMQMMNATIDTIAKLEFLVFEQVFFSLPLLFLSYILLYFWINWLKSRTMRASVFLMTWMLIFTGTLLVESFQSDKSYAFVVFQQYKKSLIIDQRGTLLYVYSNADPKDPNILRALRDYKQKYIGMELIRSKRDKNFFRIGNKKLMVVDHKSVNTDFGFDPDIIVLANSPKINLDRFINQTKPTVIVADGSNYETFKTMWEKSAKSKGILFYDTAKQGAFIISNPS